MNIEYKKDGDYLIPDLEFQEQEPVGKYGRMRLDYLKEFRKSEYTRLRMAMELNPYLVELDKKAYERVNQLVEKLLEASPAPEKSAPNLAWVKHMNNLKDRAEEIMYKELIYPEESMTEK